MMIYVINAHNKMFSSYMITKKEEEGKKTVLVDDVWICFQIIFNVCEWESNITFCKIMFGNTTEIYNLISFIDGLQSLLVFLLWN